MRLTRRVTFSSGHRYWRSDLSEEQNRALWGPWASPYNHGHNYILDVSCDGPVHPETGMVVNIKDIDAVLKEHIVHPFHMRSLNDEVPEFQTASTSLESLLVVIEKRLSGLPNDARLTHLRLEEMPTLWAELDTLTRTMTVTRTYEFAASHRLHVPSFSEEENIRQFGKCNNPAGHGHNYIVEVTVTGTPDPVTGFICDLGQLDDVVNSSVVDRYDHKNLNEDLEEFHGKVTTSETLAQEIWDRLVERVPAKLTRVRLHETARNIFEVNG